MTNSSTNNSTIPTSSDLVDFVVGELTRARLSALIKANEIETTIAGLRGDLISIEAAVAHLDELCLISTEASSSAEAA